MSNDNEKKVEQENDCEPYITYIKMQRRKSSIHPAKWQTKLYNTSNKVLPMTVFSHMPNKYHKIWV
jgi:hypothetical protein